MIQWVIIFVMLVVECVALLALIIPLPLAVKRGFMKLLTCAEEKKKKKKKKKKKANSENSLW
jgi:hypothetical protein